MRIGKDGMVCTEVQHALAQRAGGLFALRVTRRGHWRLGGVEAWREGVWSDELFCELVRSFVFLLSVYLSMSGKKVNKFDERVYKNDNVAIAILLKIDFKNRLRILPKWFLGGP